MDKMEDVVILGTGGISIIRLIEEINENKPTFQQKKKEFCKKH